jgi:hypothetical protein
LWISLAVNPLSYDNLAIEVDELDDGHEEEFPQRRLSRCRFLEGSSAAGEAAPTFGSGSKNSPERDLIDETKATQGSI